ncbi:relaxase/mobilization nuclease domain-containing protein [Agathobaculum sp.]|uniref:relaxase/mobilization nuclease domain-containing protein n=1 Tax=Agathobaculum sp. TaxID=2048138 RepID=UPI002A7EA8DE|nr:relaxase/mobilization nuclease domain-containing protein [Agathobaculum sp.]MDY3618462.1 relaxase/mobilization nuclease domain-containing protein [Agathobaculum sp.]
MAICKHIASHNLLYSAAVDYLTKMHDESSFKPILDADGQMVERPEYLIGGVNCSPETWTRDCWRDARRYRKNRMDSEVKTHQYIISFAPGDTGKGLTLKECGAAGEYLAKTYFKGHRVLICAHPDGAGGSGNMHVHIIVCSIRCADREPDPTWMRLRADGTVKPSEYKAGYKHQDTAVLRHRIDNDLRDFCRSRGYAYLPEGHRAPRKRSAKEEKIKRAGQRKLDQTIAEKRARGEHVQQGVFLTQQDELCQAISDAAKISKNVLEFKRHLQEDSYRMTELLSVDGRRKEKQKIAIDVKFSRGRISYKHPDATGWVRGKTLGALYDEKAIQKQLTANKKREHAYGHDER